MIEVKNVKLDTEVLDKFAANLGITTDEALKSTAFQVEAYAKSRAPVLTGALKNSINTQQVRLGTYWVQDGVEYGLYQELGTSKGLAAHPFMVPATENAVRDLIEAVKKVYEK